jgi:hypothetical protein
MVKKPMEESRNDCIANSAEKKPYAWIQFVFHVAIYEIENSCRKDIISGGKVKPIKLLLVSEMTTE